VTAELSMDSFIEARRPHGLVRNRDSGKLVLEGLDAPRLLEIWQVGVVPGIAHPRIMSACEKMMMTLKNTSNGDPLATPVFLVGSERSGTTMLRLMLDHHPDIAFNLESEFLVSNISAAGVFPDLVSYRQMLRESRVFRHSHFNVPEDLDFPALANDFLRQKLERDGKRLVGATVHRGFSKLRYLWPRAKYIYLLRDGRDVACSVVDIGWAGNVFVGAKWWIDAEREWAEYQKFLTRDQWIEIRYEDLVANSEAQLRRICDFIGVDFSERMYDYTETSSYSLPDPAESFKWRSKVPAGDLQLLEARLGLQLAARGYEPSCETPPEVSQARAKWMRWQSRLGVLRHRLATFGFRLFALELISRRLGLKTLHANTRRAMDVIIDQNLK
jgi:hypothetical protein